MAFNGGIQILTPIQKLLQNGNINWSQMARKFNYRKKKRGYRKRRYGYNNKYRSRNKAMTKNNSIATGIPDRLFQKMKYTEIIDVNTTGIGQYNVFRGNSLHDPNYFIGGGSATGLTEWSAFYGRYRVHSSKAQVQVLNVNTSAANSTIIVALIPTNNAGLQSIPVEDVNTLPYCKYTTIAAASGGPMPAKLTNYMSTRKMQGLKNVYDEDYGSVMGASPLKQWFWDLSYQNMDVSSTVTIRVLITITYYVELYLRDSRLNIVNTVTEGDNETGDMGPQGPFVPE